ncbi:interferon lambda-3 [Bufo bufo]|uniref:interferon lambda-3 n=1 Tax=Bufo bufo TaxID=8384 RepID=UPI001ABE10FF|nr:interferon lambda-3 [Bufo bufo]
MEGLEIELRSTAERLKTTKQEALTMDIRLLALLVSLVVVGGRPHRRLCPLFQHSSMSTSEVKSLRHLRNDQQKKISGDGVKCYTTMTRHKTSICDLTPSDRLILTLERVSLTLDVLTNMSTSDTVTNSMKAFLKLRDQLTICRELPKYSDPASEQLEPWLSHLQDFKEKASPQCVQDAVVLNLISLRMQNVMCPSNP